MRADIERHKEEQLEWIGKLWAICTEKGGVPRSQLFHKNSIENRGSSFWQDKLIRGRSCRQCVQGVAQNNVLEELARLL